MVPAGDGWVALSVDFGGVLVAVVWRAAAGRGVALEAGAVLGRLVLLTRLLGAGASKQGWIEYCQVTANFLGKMSL